MSAYLDKIAGTGSSFSEFVKFVLREEDEGMELDMHWAPVYSFCNPCQVNFTDIVMFETLERDSEEVIRSAGIGHLVKIHKKNAGKEKSAEVTRSLLKKLGKDLYNKIVDVYKVDFDIFGYEKKRFEDL